jgi:hypothetical protein
MMCWMTSFVVAVFAVGSAVAADLPDQSYRSGKAYGQSHRRHVYVEEEPELLFTPSDGAVPYIPPLIGTPLLPGSATLPGYYGSTHSYNYQGPYYGGPYLGYWNRLPYACGVYGYC